MLHAVAWACNPVYVPVYGLRDPRDLLSSTPGTKAALADQLQLGQELKRKMEGRRGGGSDDDTDASDDDASTSASDGEGGEGGEAGEEGAKARPSAASGRLRSAALELLAGAHGSEVVVEDCEDSGLYLCASPSYHAHSRRPKAPGCAPNRGSRFRTGAIETNPA